MRATYQVVTHASTSSACDASVTAGTEAFSETLEVASTELQARITQSTDGAKQHRNRGALYARSQHSPHAAIARPRERHAIHRRYATHSVHTPRQPRSLSENRLQRSYSRLSGTTHPGTRSAQRLSRSHLRQCRSESAATRCAHTPRAKQRSRRLWLRWGWISGLSVFDEEFWLEDFQAGGYSGA
jgi:hypothetical protein